MNGNDLGLFWALAFPNLKPSILGATFSAFSYVAVRAENRTHHLHNAERMCYVLRHNAKSEKTKNMFKNQLYFLKELRKNIYFP